MDPLLTEVQRRSVPLHAVRPPPPLHPTKLAAALPRPSTGPAAAKSLTSQPQVREDVCTRFAPEGIEITQFDSEAEVLICILSLGAAAPPTTMPFYVPSCAVTWLPV